MYYTIVLIVIDVITVVLQQAVSVSPIDKQVLIEYWQQLTKRSSHQGVDVLIK